MVGRRRVRSGAVTPLDVERRWTALVVSVLVVLTVTAYLPVHRAGWVQDDHVAIESNPIVARGNPGEIWTTDYWAGASGEDATLYRPVAIQTWAWESAWAGAPSPALTHLVNLGIHLAVSLALFGLARRWGAGPLGSSAAALMFAVHPVHVEAVAGGVGRSELLAALGVVVALWAATFTGRWDVGGRAVSPTVRRLAAWTAGVAVFVALGSKETAIAVFPVLLVQEWLFRPREAERRSWWIERAASLAPCALALVGMFLLRVRALGAWWATQSPHPIDNPLIVLDGGPRLLAALALVPRYAGLLLFPHRQSADYSGPTIPVDTPSIPVLAAVGALVLAACAVLVGVGRGRRGGSRGLRCPAAAAALFLVPYLVVGNVLVPIGTIFAERLMYLPSAGFCVLAGWGLAALATRYPAFRDWTIESRSRYVGVVLVLVVAAFAVQTYGRATVWQDDRSVFADVVESHPTSPRGWFVLGRLDLDAGRPAEALAKFERAAGLEPRYVPAWFEAGNALARMGRYRDAIERYDRALALSPQFALAHLNRGLALQRLGRLAESRRAIRRCLAVDPDDATAWATLGHLAVQQGRTADAIAPYRRAIALGRDDLRDRLRRLESGRPVAGPGSADVP